MQSARLTAARILHVVAHEGHNLDDAFETYLADSEPSQHAFIKAMCFGSVRYYFRLSFFLHQLMDKPIRNKEKLIECLLLNALYELFFMQTPDHASVSETVKVVQELKKQWAKGLCNAVLRNAVRQRKELENAAEQNPQAHFAHPNWLIKKLKQHWPQQAKSILLANQQPGPFTLRVNSAQIARADYLQQLQQKHFSATLCPFSADALTLTEPCDVNELPGFSTGQVSVQDQAAQLACLLLDAHSGERILDACAAPGGKTAHILERQADLDLLAIDVSASRLAKVADNLQRLQLHAQLIAADAADTQSWWDTKPFDRILLDAPCSATGVIRRHPDIKLLRRAEDIAQLCKTQAHLLSSLWPLLKTGGMLLYVTCSVLAEENEQQIQYFIQQHPDAEIIPMEASWGQAQTYGRQILPGEQDMDGFYFSLLRKRP